MMNKKIGIAVLALIAILLVPVLFLAKNDLLGLLPKTEQQQAEAVEYGRQIYRQGILPSGQALTAKVQHDVEVNGTQLACINCHRRSGFGSSEGSIVSPPITHEVLFNALEPQAKELLAIRQAEIKTRPAYNAQTLAKIIRTGVNPNNRQLDALMPHYQLNDNEMDYLLAYLQTLSGRNSPGVDDKTLHLATIVSDGVDPEQSDAMLNIMTTFAETINTETRPNTRRTEHAPWHKQWHYQSYRKWQLHTWRLTGDAQTWGEQLQALYQQQPVFAVVGGLVAGSWRPIDQFCEHSHLPCLFPQTELPKLTDNGFYTVYFSKGIALEAEVLAKYIGANKNRANPNIVQLFSNQLIEQTGAEHFRQQLVKYALNVNDVMLQGEQSTIALNAAQQQELDSADYIVIWLDNPALSAMALNAPANTDAKIFFVGSRIKLEQTLIDQLKTFKQTLYLTYPYLQPEKKRRIMQRSLRWIQLRNQTIAYPELQANTLFSMTLLSRAVKHIGSHFSRDYLIERIEHLEDNFALSPTYPHLSLGGEQRFASQGAYIARLDFSQPEPIQLITDWIIP